MKRKSDNIQSYPIPDLSTQQKQDAFIADEMQKAEEHFRKQLGCPKAVTTPPGMRKPRVRPVNELHVYNVFFIGLMITAFVIVGCFLVWLAFMDKNWVKALTGA